MFHMIISYFLEGLPGCCSVKGIRETQDDNSVQLRSISFYTRKKFKGGKLDAKIIEFLEHNYNNYYADSL